MVKRYYPPSTPRYARYLRARINEHKRWESSFRYSLKYMKNHGASAEDIAKTERDLARTTKNREGFEKDLARVEAELAKSTEES